MICLVPGNPGRGNFLLVGYFYLENIFSLYIKMKITSIRSEDLVYRTTNNDLTEDDKNILIEVFKPKKYKHNPSPESIKRQNEWRRNKYHKDEEFR